VLITFFVACLIETIFREIIAVSGIMSVAEICGTVSIQREAITCDDDSAKAISA